MDQEDVKFWRAFHAGKVKTVDHKISMDMAARYNYGVKAFLKDVYSVRHVKDRDKRKSKKG
jgi:hypothetical protein